MRSCFLVKLEMLIIFICYLFIYILFIVVSALFVPESNCSVIDEAYCCGVTEAHFSQIMLLC
jgi:hypothetical protein